jgi:hypothetical protein
MKVLVYILFDEVVQDRQVYEIAENIEYKGWEHIIGIKKGFKTDLVSRPWPLALFAAPTGRWGYAAIFHDFLYKTHLVSRKEADEVFYKIMKDTNVKFYKRFLAYWAVRLLGWHSYKEHFTEKDLRYGYVTSIQR